MDPLAVRLQGVCRRYPRFTLDDIDLELPAGRTLGLIGPNGAGKSTLLRILLGLVRVDSGVVEVLGLPLPRHERRIKQEVGFVSEDMCLYHQATLSWHMDLVASLSPNWDRALATQLTERFALDPGQPLRGWSRGQQVKAMLILALARRPRLLLLDEPTAGLDPLVRRELLDLMADIRADGRTIIWSSHLTEDVAALSDDILFIEGGRGVLQATAALQRHWRRVEIELAPGQSIAIAGVHVGSRRGNRAVLVGDQLDQAALDRLGDDGVRVVAVGPASLEDIFLARIGRAGVRPGSAAAAAGVAA